MIVTISGKGGSGKTTVGKLLAERLDYRYYDAGFVRRMYAESQGMSLAELNQRAISDPTSDRLVDEYMAELGRREDGLVVNGRLAYLMIPKSFKVFITVDDVIAAQRVMKDTGPGRSVERFGSLEEAIADIRARQENDTRRYLALYGANPYADGNYDAVLDSSHMTQTAVVERILRELSGRGLLREGKSI